MALNTLGIFYYFFCQWIITVVVVRLAGFDAAGIFSLAVAFSNIFAFIGLFGVRGYQICDVHEKYSNGEYVASRIVSTGVSLLPFAALLCIRGYDRDTTLSCIAFMLFKSLEGFSDVFWGIMQRSNRFTWLAVSCVIKGTLILFAFTALLLAGQSLFIAILGMSVVYLPVLVFYDSAKLRVLGTFSLSFGNLRGLFISCFPLMLHSLLLAIIIYLPRESIGRILGEKNVGYYGSLAMVIVLFSTLACAVWGAITPAMSHMIALRNTTALRRLVIRALVSISAASVAILLLGKLLGPWAFGIVFGKEIMPYMYLLTPVLINSILLVFVTFFDGLFVALEQRTLLLLCNVLGTAFCWISVSSLTQVHGMYGANLSMIGGLTLRFLLLSALSLWLINKRLGPPTIQSTNSGVDISAVP